MGHCTINPLAHLPFDPDALAPAKKSAKVLVIGGGVAGMQAAMTACDRGHQVTIVEKTDKLGGLLYFTDVDIDKPDLRNFKNMMNITNMIHHLVPVRMMYINVLGEVWVTWR